jgi:hypothetical protein
VGPKTVARARATPEGPQIKRLSHFFELTQGKSRDEIADWLHTSKTQARKIQSHSIAYGEIKAAHAIIEQQSAIIDHMDVALDAEIAALQQQIEHLLIENDRLNSTLRDRSAELEAVRPPDELAAENERLKGALESIAVLASQAAAARADEVE